MEEEEELRNLYVAVHFGASASMYVGHYDVRVWCAWRFLGIVVDAVYLMGAS